AVQQRSPHAGDDAALRGRGGLLLDLGPRQAHLLAQQPLRLPAQLLEQLRRRVIPEVTVPAVLAPVKLVRHVFSRSRGRAISPGAAAPPGSRAPVPRRTPRRAGRAARRAPSRRSRRWTARAASATPGASS